MIAGIDVAVADDRFEQAWSRWRQRLNHRHHGSIAVILAHLDASLPPRRRDPNERGPWTRSVARRITEVAS